LSEVWSVSRVLDAEPALIEAAAYGATLESAAAARLEEAIGAAIGMGTLAKYLREAVLVGIDTLASRLVSEIGRAAGSESSFSELGQGLSGLVALHEHDVLFGAKDATLIGEAIRVAFDRGIWLVEGIDGDAGQDEVSGVVALRNALKLSGTKL